MMNQTKTTFFNHMHDEATALLSDVRNYIREEQEDDMAGLSAYDCLRIHCENTRITTRLMCVIGWMLVQKALHEGVISSEEACERDFVMPAQSTYLENDFANDERIPERLRDLLDKSRKLYQRVTRLNHQVNMSMDAALLTLH